MSGDRRSRNAKAAPGSWPPRFDPDGPSHAEADPPRLSGDRIRHRRPIPRKEPHPMRAIRLVVLASVLALASTASAQGLKGTGTYGAAGCGLGSMVFGNQPGFFQLLAGTTNHIIFFNQFFGITFGTSNCSPGIINVVGT